MPKKKKKSTQKTWSEIFQSVRRTWEIDPRTKVIPDKRKKKPKHKENYDE